jgi:hypothetical protein
MVLVVVVVAVVVGCDMLQTATEPLRTAASRRS